jgi:ATP-dependent Clp protease ATP-binding subunit ClpA
MTTNAGAQYAKQTIGFNNTIQSGDNMMKSVKSTFKPEFLNRLTSITIFNDMNKEMAGLILSKKLSTLESQLLNKKIKLSISSTAKEYLLQVGFSPIYGGREIDRVITSKVKPLIMRAILHGELRENMIANIDFIEDRISLICSKQ